MLTQEKFRKKFEREKQRSLSRQRKQILKDEKSKYRNRKKPSTSKILLVMVILICVEVLAFCEYAYLTNPEPGTLGSVIGSIATIVSLLLGYFWKSKAENTSGGIVFESAMAGLNDIINNGEDAVG